MKHFKTISESHQFWNLPKPQHPLISIINVGDVKPTPVFETVSLIFDFYCIAVKRVNNLKVKYGQQPFDSKEGIMSFMAPNQVLSITLEKEKEIKKSGWLLLIHPDFLWNTSLAKIIKNYDFWDYSLYEALSLSEKEENIINSIVQNIEKEYHSNIDKFSKPIIISQIETLLNYSERFYNRQFITSEKDNHKILESLENLLNDYFDKGDLVNTKLPTVQSIAQQLHLSPKYLSSLLKTLTGQNTQQHIHEKLIEKAKEKLSCTPLSVSEIAYELGFEHLQSFSKLFKSKTALSPSEFRHTFNL